MIADVPPANTLPVDAHLPRIRDLVERHRALVVVAPPGSGKSTRVPPALASRGALILLQPRRVAARSLARRIAAEQGLRLEHDVGWQVRGERRFHRGARLLVATEGILTARLQADPLLTEFATVVVDEAHERSLHGDLALALSREAAAARDDLALVVMSATLDAGPVAEFLGGAPVVEIEARPHPVEIEHDDGGDSAAIVRGLLGRRSGDVLVFLPGTAEIQRLATELRDLADVDVLPLHGGLPPGEQERALRPGRRRRVVLATNVAETSVTVEGVTNVIDLGLRRVARYDAERAIDRLVTERVSWDSAEQRAGRAGRTGPGLVVRAWDRRERLASRIEPEITRVDLSGALLEVLAWGADPRDFAWLEAPPPERIEEGLALLERLGAVEHRTGAPRLTELGSRLQRLPVTPRLARVLVEASGSWLAAASCALLSERLPRSREEAPTTSCDLLRHVDALSRADSGRARALRRTAEELQRAACRVLGVAAQEGDETALRRALLAGFGDRVARRRPLDGDGRGERRAAALQLASGTGARLAAESGVRDAEWLVALDLRRGPSGGEAIVRLACAVERSWLVPDAIRVDHELDRTRRRVVATEREMLGALVLVERPADPDPSHAERLLLEMLEAEPLAGDDERLLRRAVVAGVELDLAAVRAAAVTGRVDLPRVELASWLNPEQRRRLDELAPETVSVPSGRRARLDYREDGTVVLSIKLQELFGLPEPPRVGEGRAPVLVELLSPAGRPVQVTSDLASFWRDGYARVRAELRGRYPKHPWPEDPLSAVPTARTKRASGRERRR